jgi:hypothetical protein
MNRYKFLDIFVENPDGSLGLRARINVNGIEFGPGVSFRPGVSFGGIDFFQYRNLDIAADEQNGVLIIRGFYKG